GDMSRGNTDKAIYTGVDPILAYRAGESKRFLDLFNSTYKELIPFSFDRNTINIKLSDIDSIFFASYDEIAFKPLANAVKRELLHSKEQNKKLIGQIEEIEVFGFARYFGEKFDVFQNNKNIDLARLFLLHQLLFRAIRERVLKTMGDFIYDTKYNAFLQLMDDLSEYFFDDTPYDVQCERFLTNCEGNIQSIGLMKVKEFNKLSEKFKSFSGTKITGLNWEINGYSTQAASRNDLDNLLKEISVFDKKSGFKFAPSSIFELDIRGLSTGEKQFLKLFSRFGFNHLFKPKSKLRVKTMLLLLDEFDLGFHPRWQQKYLKELIRYLELIVEKSGKELTFQIILTSHSPFIVSDLPRECINFIRKAEDDPYSYVDSSFQHHATFGENIHDLFKESFFLDGALMGDFAKKKINDGFENLQDVAKPLDEGLIKTLIRITGEPLIKLKLSEMYAERTGESSEIANLRIQQQYINKRLKELESNVANKKDVQKKP
ncbi:AAA family ATPase, partial [Niastella populi]